ncbi:phosphotransferase family protein [Photorhabdus bodei]|uniref:Phosphotransferase family protein n=2 Tax=Photorhabdus bodei TaxID=2029681 RepID=A0A329X263_9GAMM|nr:phosphotransferase family protein [Photorhabdus bodei]
MSFSTLYFNQQQWSADMIFDIPLAENWQIIEPENRGWSKDQKYHVVDKQGKNLLLRLADISQENKKKQEFFWTQQLFKQNIPMSEPINFGICNNGQSVYSLLNWIEGQDTTHWLEQHNEQLQYEAGLQAGKHLKKIHQLTIPSQTISPRQEAENIYQEKLARYEQCGIKIPHEADFTDFIKDNFSLLDNVSPVFLHGDYHVGNMIIDNKYKLWVIDFNRYRFGDPAKDFSQMMIFSRLHSTEFVHGQMDGYFAGQPSQEFLKRIAFHTAYNAFFSLLWAQSFGEKTIQNCLNRINMIWHDYQGFKRSMPSWYKP